MLFLFLVNFVFADTLFVSSEVDVSTIKTTSQDILWATQEVKNLSTTPPRTDLIQNSQDFLEGKVSKEEFEKLMIQWSRTGWTEIERSILLDVLRKKEVPIQNQKNWLCRLQQTKNCDLDSLNVRRLPLDLLAFEWLILDGRPIPRVQWQDLKVSSDVHSWLFLSSKFKPIHFEGDLRTLPKQKFITTAWLTGDCNHYQVDASIANLSNRVYFSENCVKPALIPLVKKDHFYDKHKKAIWWTLGVALGAGVIHSIKGKTLVIEKPGFM